MDNPQKQLTGLPFHLLLAAWEWMSLKSVLQSASVESPFSKLLSSLPPSLSPLGNWPQELQNPELVAVLKNEADKRFFELLKGIHHYQSQAPQPLGTKYSVVQEIGAARLLSYPALAPSKRRTIFLVPSLINRFHILDLNTKLSFVRFLQNEGYDCLILDWGNPSEADADKGCEYYITKQLLPFLAWARKQNKNKLILAGYCMGGVLATAAAQLAPKSIDALALFATPWNFHSADFFRIGLNDIEQGKLSELLAHKPLLSAETVQMLFYASNPFVFHEKFRRFAEETPSNPTVKDFLAIEQWVNDGVAMTRKLASECLIGWVQENQPMKGNWRIGKKTIRPEKLKLPVFIAAPTDDRIVPSGCALALATLIPAARLILPACGHVGMMVGNQRRVSLWQPFADWVAEIF